MTTTNGDGLFWNGSPQYEKESGQTTSLAHVLITVKAAPQPSAGHGDTVCVAGIKQDKEGPRWIRLYPIPFRHIEEESKFRKYDVVDVPVTPARSDPRAESYRPDLAQLRITGHVDGGKRIAWVGPLIDRTSMCEALRLIRADKLAPSLLAITPRDISGLKLSPGGDWTADERRKMEAHAQQAPLFGPEKDTKILEKPRFTGHFKYRCQDAACNGHEQGLLDWEFVALQRRHRYDDDATAMTAIRKRFLDELCNPDRGPVFFLGNQAKREHVFSVLGVFRSRY